MEEAAALMFAMGLGVAALAALVATALAWLVWLVARRLGLARGAIGKFPAIPVSLVFLLFATPASCGWAFRPRPQPAGAQQVAALEVPLATAADRADFMATLERFAREGGLHVDDSSDAWVRMSREAALRHEEGGPARTISLSVYRGRDDDDPEAFVDDDGHQGRPWIMFLRGEHPERASRLRLALVGELKRRWPGSRDVPVMPNGAFPLAHDLVWTGTAYVVRPDRIADYAKRGD